MIMGFADIQDICFDGSDLVEETITAFTRLLRDEAKMKVCNLHTYILLERKFIFQRYGMNLSK
jgi:hypothetical protein